MPDSDRPRRSRRRLAAAAALSASAAVAALSAPAPAAAYEQSFCANVFLASGTNCYAPNKHTLQYVRGWSIGSNDRVCAASFTSPGGSQNSTWHCDYTYVEKWLGGVVGHGGIRNGDPQGFVGYGVQGF